MKIYDVTIPLSENIPVFPGDPKVKIEKFSSLENGDSANVSQIFCCTHAATHVDAPSHFIEGGKKIDEIDLNKLIGDCYVMELDKNVTVITAEHVENLDNVERLLFKTRNSEFWNETEQVFREDFTYIEPKAARILVEKGIKLVGIDYLSVDKFGSVDFPTHKILLENEVVILEGLDLREVSAGDYEIICLPLKIQGGTGDGAPARTILRKKE